MIRARAQAQAQARGTQDPALAQQETETGAQVLAYINATTAAANPPTASSSNATAAAIVAALVQAAAEAEEKAHHQRALEAREILQGSTQSLNGSLSVALASWPWICYY